MMGNKPVLFLVIGLLLIGLCLFGYGVLNIIGSTSSPANASWLWYGMGFAVVGGGFIVGGVFLIIRSQTNHPSGGSITHAAYTINLPSQTRVEQLKCNNCGGGLKADHVKMIAGAPTVECPFCGTTYQLTEEPKW